MVPLYTGESSRVESKSQSKSSLLILHHSTIPDGICVLRRSFHLKLFLPSESLVSPYSSTRTLNQQIPYFFTPNRPSPSLRTSCPLLHLPLLGTHSSSIQLSNWSISSWQRVLGILNGLDKYAVLP